MAISVWPLESDSNVIHQDLFFSFLDQMYLGEGVLKDTDLNISEDIEGIGVKVASGGLVISYESAPGGKRVFFNSVESKSGPNEFVNPSFAVDLTGWVALGGSTVTRDTVTFHTAPAAAKIVTGGASTYTRGITLSATNMRANPNEQKEVSCWVNVPLGVQVKLRVTEHNSGLAQIAANETIAGGTGAWNQVKCNFRTNTATRFLKIEVSVNSGASQTFYVDDFEMSRNFDWIAGFQSAHPTLPRVDRVVVQIRDQNVTGGGDTSTDGKFRVLPGTPTSGATLVNLTGAAAVPVNSFLLANVLVPAGATILAAANIDNSIKQSVDLNVPAPVIPPIPDELPLGIPYPYMGTAAPSGYLMLIGQTISRTTYAALFAVVGVSYNTGGEAGTDFRLPDMRGRMPVGLGTNVDVNTLGKNEGETTVGNRRPKHKHPGSTDSQGSHSHGGSASFVGDHSHSTDDYQGLNFNLTEGTAGGVRSYLEPRGKGMSGAGNHSHTITTDSQGAHTHGYTAGPGSNSPTDAPAYMVFNWICKDGL